MCRVVFGSRVVQIFLLREALATALPKTHLAYQGFDVHDLLDTASHRSSIVRSEVANLKLERLKSLQLTHSP